MPYNKEIPYNDLPDLPPQTELENKAILKLTVIARTALAELRALGKQIPNQAILVRSIGIQEAKASSEIENIVTTNDALYRALSDPEEEIDKATKEVLRYQDALWIGLNEIQQKPVLTANLFSKIASTIKQQEMDVRKVPGTKLISSSGATVYTPPESESIIRSKLTNLEKFIHDQSDLDPLVKLAVIHYQFEAIHPFSDGNGRSGRILNILYLIWAGLLDMPVLYLSKYLIEQKHSYYTLMRGVTERHDWHSWVSFILEAIAQTATDTTNKIISITDLMRATQEQVKERLPKIYSWELIETLFYQPYCKTRFLEEKGIAKRQTAAAYLRALEDIGFLQSVKIGRENYFINRQLLDLLKS
jgi:Fic family protein